MFLYELTLRGILSFGMDNSPIELGPLNVLIGPNAAGKSNVIEAVSLLRAAPVDLSGPVETAGVSEWLWKGVPDPVATISAVTANPEKPEMPLRHVFSFRGSNERFRVLSERIENRDPYEGYSEPFYYYRMENESPRLKELGLGDRSDGTDRGLQRDAIRTDRSILSQVKDPERYPALTYLSNSYDQIQFYRDWSLGRGAAPRQAQKADLPARHLLESGENLSLVLNALKKGAKGPVLEALTVLYPDITDFGTDISAGLVQLYVNEGRFVIPATRLSDGTLRYLSLIAILLDPEPPPLICIEEPEIGLHPDAIPQIAELLRDASTRTQLLVTTHSEMLVDSLSDTPESVIVCEKEDGSTRLLRLDRAQLSNWLERYRLGQLWLKGVIGGTRW